MDPSHVTTNNHVVIGRDTEAHGAMLATAIQPRRGDGRPQRATAIQGEQQRRAPLERHAAFTTLPFAPPTGRPGTPCVEADTPFHPQLTGGAVERACPPVPASLSLSATGWRKPPPAPCRTPAANGCDHTPPPPPPHSPLARLHPPPPIAHLRRTLRPTQRSDEQHSRPLRGSPRARRLRSPSSHHRLKCPRP